MSEEFTVREDSAEASVEVCSNLPERLTITRNVSVIVDVQQRGEAEGQLNRHTWQSFLLSKQFQFLVLTAVNSDFVFSPFSLEFCLTNSTMACENVTITITNDDTPEEDEYFYAVLTTNDSGVKLRANVINITIMDDDNATIIIQRLGMVSF